MTGMGEREYAGISTCGGVSTDSAIFCAENSSAQV